MHDINFVYIVQYYARYNVVVHVYCILYIYTTTHIYMCQVLCNYVWLPLPSNQRLIAGFRMGVADCGVYIIGQ